MAARTSKTSGKDFKQLLKSSEPASVYFFHGVEEQRAKQAVRKIREKFLKDADPSTGWTVYDLAETPFGTVLDDVRTVSFFGGKRGVLVVNIDGAKTKSGIRIGENEQEQLFAYIENPSPDVMLIFAAGKIDSRLKFWKTLKQKTASVLFESSEGERRDIISAKLNSLPYSFAPDARAWALEYFNGHFAHLDSELEKLTVFIGERTQVALDDLENSMSSVKLLNVFQLAKSIGMKKLDDSLAALRSLKTQGEPLLKIFAMIARQFRILLVLRSCVEERLSREETARIMQKFRVPPFYLDEYKAQAALFGADKLKEIICTLNDISLKTRKSSMNEWMILEEELVSLIVKDAA